MSLLQAFPRARRRALAGAATAGLTSLASLAGCAGLVAFTGLAGFAPPASAADRPPAFDLLQLPARADLRAPSALQLAVARAGERLVSVGERGIVLLSDDDGRHWRQARSVPASVALTDVQFVSAARGWAVGHGGVVLRSDDGGETWALQLDGNRAAQAALDEARRHAEAGVPGAERALRGANALVEDGPDKPLLGVHFADAQRGWAVGAYGLALATEDGGAHWQAIMGRIPNPRGKHLYQVREDGGALVIAGEQGALFRSDDGGASFHEVATPYAGTYFGVLGAGGNALLAFGLRGNAWRSDDGQTGWHPVDLGQPVTVSAGLRLRDGSFVLADESGRLLRSIDGAHRFAVLRVPAVAGPTGLAQAADGALILSSARGPVRIAPEQLDAGAPR